MYPGSGGVDGPEGRVWAKALDLLARRPHFRRQLRRKLLQRGFEEECVEGALQRLSELGYLNDLEQALSLVRGPLSRKGYGPRRVRAELERRGAPGEVVAEALREAFPDGETTLAVQVAARWKSRGGTGRERLARHLERKGFSKHVIVDLLDAGEQPGIEELP